MNDIATPTIAEQAPIAMPPSAAPHHVFLIDGSGFIFRAYFARAKDPTVQRFQTKSGLQTEVVMIFSNMLDKYLRETDADHIAVIFDASGRSFRNEIYGEYKANRREMPDDLAPQLKHVRRAAEAFGVCQIEMENFEADDLIATYARHAVETGAKVTILSSDKDMMQLVSDGRVMMRDPMTDRPIGEAEVREKFGVGPDKVIEVQALCGDSTDNVPGVPGIGVKTAAELINSYGDLETLLAHAHEIKQPKRREALIENEAKARLSKELVKLDDDVPLPCPLSDLRVAPYDPEKLFPFLDEMELRALKSRIEKRLAITAPAAPVGPTEPVIPEIPSFSMPRTYAVVDTMEGLDHWIEAAEQAGHVALWPAPSLVSGTRPEFCGLALAVSPGLAAYVPLGHRSTELFDGAAGLSREDAVARLKPLLEHPGVLKILHDAKGAAHLLRRYAIALNPYDCTMLMSYVLDGGQFDHTIEEVARRALEHELVPQKEILGTGKNLICFAELTSAAARDFAAERADAALRLHTLLKARLLREHMNAFYETIERPFVLAATATGRFSSSEPNIQNIPIRTEEGRKIRRAFVAEPGHLLLSADYSQIELRLAAHVADIPELKAAFQQGHDIHALTASEVFGVPLEKMDPQTRRRAKAINFGIIYGISAFGLGNQIGVPQSEAAEYIRAYFERFPAIRAYMERIKTDARRTGYVETIFGRKCFIPGIRDPNPARRAGAERQAINAPLQGSAADIIKRAMGRLPAALERAGLKARMLLQVHDELLFEAPEAEVEATAKLVKNIMEGACAPRCEVSVPLVVETGWARSWDQAH